jgi:post-segregation antitoxin (ccd killing protein)
LSTTVLSVRVRKELKEEAEKLGISLREVVERALEEEIRRVKMERIKKLMEEALKSMSLREEDWARIIKESRLEK